MTSTEAIRHTWIVIEFKDEILTPSEAAAMLRLSTRTLARYREDGIVPAQRYSPRMYRFRKSDIIAFLDRTRIEPCDYLE